MEKRKENKEYRIDKKEAFLMKKTEKIIITTKKVKVSVQSTRVDRVQIMFSGTSPMKVGLKIKRREDGIVVTTEEGSEIGNVELKIAIPESLKYLSIGTTSGKVKLESTLPEELRIKTKYGQVTIDHAPDRDANVHISTMKADIYTDFKAVCVEVEAKSVSGKTYNSHKTNGESTVKLEASTISGDIHVS